MVLTEQEESLIGLLRRLPAAEAGKIMTWALALQDLAKQGPVEWSDAWSDEDMRDASVAALRRFDEEEDR